MNKVELGCGLIGIGRKWGVIKTQMPTAAKVNKFLDKALKLEINFFDTAPAYGSSEERLGKWLKKLSKKDRSSITIATKFGEHWINDDASTVVDHSFVALKESLDQSLERLGSIDVLQLHKASINILNSKNVARAFKYAKSKGINKFGASVCTLEAGKVAIESGMFSYLQFPFNRERKELIELVYLCTENKITPIINRPVNMGNMLKKDKRMNLIAAYSYAVNTLPYGIILTGTKNIDHLKENFELVNELI